jgi:hypothetical protein
MTTSVFLDKSFLFGVKTETFRALLQHTNFIISDATLYELVTTSEPQRSNCIRKFGPGITEIQLVSFVGPMIKREVKTHAPAGLPSQFREVGVFAFNPNLFGGGYELPADAQKAVDEKYQELQMEIDTLVSRVEHIPSHFPELRGGDKASLQSVEALIALPGSFLPLYSHMSWPDKSDSLPPVSKINEFWAIYRYLQVQMLFAAHLFYQYNGKLPPTTHPKFNIKLEHDVLDADQLILGCLQGAFASNEKKLKRWFKLLCPNGLLLEV